jgi:hypothetical protein
MITFGVLGVAVVAAAPDPWAAAKRLGDSTASGRAAAASELLSIGAAAGPALDEAAKSTDVDVRTRARALAALVRRDADIRARQVDVAVLDAFAAPSGLDAGSATDARLGSLMPESSRALAAAARRIAERGFVSPPLASSLARRPTQESLAVLAELVRDERVLPSSTLRAARELDDALAANRDFAATIRSEATAPLATLDAALRATSPSTRRGAVALYGALAGDAGAARMAEMTLDPDAAVRAETVRVMGAHSPDESAATLRELACDPIAAVREAALTALLRVPGVPHPEPAVARAADPCAAVRAAAATLLGREATPETICVLEALAVDASPRVRAAARRSLASLRS